jgi:predicted ester cyclase
MSAEQNKAALRRQYEAFDGRDQDQGLLDQIADELYTSDYVVHDPDNPMTTPGPEFVKQFQRGLLASMPDLKITIKDLFAEGDRVASRITIRGTDASTGKPVRLMALVISRFVGRQIAEEWQVAYPWEGEA